MASRSKNLSPIKCLIAPNGFKESLSATSAAVAIAKGIKQSWPGAIITSIPLADGGSGSVQTIIKAAGGKLISARVHGPRGQKIKTQYGLLADQETAIIELAAASGLALLTPAERNPMLTSSYGTGELIAQALSRNVRRIIIGIGDSATVDGGMGALQALGARFIDGHGRTIEAAGGNLGMVAEIDLSQFDPRLTKTELIIASDVSNRLLGEQGAATVFGPQKGATPSMVEILEIGLTNWARLLKKISGRAVAKLSGSGAAGGFATPFLALCQASIESGSELIFNYCRLPEQIAKADLIFTGEGAIDRQSLQGKMPIRLAKACRRAGKPLIAFAARVDLTASELKRAGFHAVVPIVDRIMEPALARLQGAELLTAATSRTIDLLKLGTSFAHLSE